MSLTSFINRTDVKDKVKPLRPRLPRKIDAVLRCEPRSNRHTMVGTAFDYLLRFEMQRQAPHTATRRWVAEAAANMICRDMGAVVVEMDLLRGAGPEHYLPPEEIAKRAQQIVEQARNAVVAYCKRKKPSDAMRITLAMHAIRLAKLDAIYRAELLDPRFEEADPEDI